MSTPKGKYRTRDLYLAAALLAQGYDMVSIDREGSQAFWTFADVDPDVLLAWHNDSLEGELRSYSDHIRALKAQAHSAD